MTGDEIRAKIDRIRTATVKQDTRRAFRPAIWAPLWEIAYQLAIHNEREALDSTMEKSQVVLRLRHFEDALTKLVYQVEEIKLKTNRLEEHDPHYDGSAGNLRESRLKKTPPPEGADS